MSIKFDASRLALTLMILDAKNDIVDAQRHGDATGHLVARLYTLEEVAEVLKRIEQE